VDAKMIPTIIKKILGIVSKKGFKIGDRVHIKGDKVTSEKKRAIQPNPDVWVIDDIQDSGYTLNMEDSSVTILRTFQDYDLIPAPAEAKNHAWQELKNVLRMSKK
jgi:hypothetical protein